MPEKPARRSAATAAPTPEPDRPASYEAAREELVEVVRRLETGGTTLEESLALWERGEQLAGWCQEWLDGARARLDAVVAVVADGSDDSEG
ncbi:exodeoxyribonuclease VII small subunit [Nocardioides sp. TRM66260-LWL]|uniref:exodeoxyribonuclease VII small subunit n=1 Tax=Nocardioides sp. TRM66260-LWL TaxID=2874478 RepID=UPI001CC3A8F7|nr:exodeoxyribonuclease VII small subunit [Nocardioides sp. TRM66260-LWL]MBZ5736194.1 exodeoxyribonuclease VII small subunit [Nocardioides sp. TRM66260-LWL]